MRLVGSTNWYICLNRFIIRKGVSYNVFIKSSDTVYYKLTFYKINQPSVNEKVPEGLEWQMNGF